MNYKLIIMTKVKNLLLTILLLCGTTIWGNNGLRISGRIKVLKPTTLQIKDMNEGVVLSCIIGTNNTFSTDEINIIPDVYKLYLGETEQNIYLENNIHWHRSVSDFTKLYASRKRPGYSNDFYFRQRKTNSLHGICISLSGRCK